MLRHYLELGLDGWRVDVANMVGRYRDVDLNRDVSRWAREQVGDALLIAEHGHDFRPDLGVRGWHGVMNYSGFLRPLWTWLLRDDPEPEQVKQFWGIPVGVPQLGGAAAVAAIRRFRAGVAPESVLHSWNLLDSHDTARFRTIAGTPERHLVGIGLQMTLPGVPMVFAGDELGVEGQWGEDARRTMPWGRETVGRRVPRRRPRADRPAPLERGAGPRRDPLGACLRRRDRLPPRDEARTSAVPRRPRAARADRDTVHRAGNALGGRRRRRRAPVQTARHSTSGDVR